MQKFGSTESFEKLHPTPSGEENYIALQPSPQSEVKFDNPMYSMKEQLGDFSDKECQIQNVYYNIEIKEILSLEESFKNDIIIVLLKPSFR